MNMHMQTVQKVLCEIQTRDTLCLPDSVLLFPNSDISKQKDELKHMIVIQLHMMSRNILTARWIPETVGWFGFVTRCCELETIHITKPEFVFVCFSIVEDSKQTVILSSSREEKGFDTLLIFDKRLASCLKYTWLWGNKKKKLRKN